MNLFLFGFCSGSGDDIISFWDKDFISWIEWLSWNRIGELINLEFDSSIDEIDLNDVSAFSNLAKSIESVDQWTSGILSKEGSLKIKQDSSGFIDDSEGSIALFTFEFKRIGEDTSMLRALLQLESIFEVERTGGLVDDAPR